MLSQLNTFINAKITSWLPLYQGPPSSLSAKRYHPQNKIHSGRTMNCLFSSIALARAELMHTSTLCCGFSADWTKVLRICHCIKVVQSRGMTIYYVMYIDPFLKRCIDKNSILIPIFYKQTKENTKPTIQSITYYIPTKNILKPFHLKATAIQYTPWGKGKFRKKQNVLKI